MRTGIGNEKKIINWKYISCRSKGSAIYQFINLLCLIEAYIWVIELPSILIFVVLFCCYDWRFAMGTLNGIANSLLCVCFFLLFFSMVLHFGE